MNRYAKIAKKRKVSESKGQSHINPFFKKSSVRELSDGRSSPKCGNKRNRNISISAKRLNIPGRHGANN